MTVKPTDERHPSAAGIADAVFATGRKGGESRVALSVVAALLMHAGVYAIAGLQGTPTRERATVAPQDTEVELEEPAPPARVEPPPPPPAEPAPPRVERTEPVRQNVQVAAVPAQAARVVAQEPEPNAPVDLSGDTFVTGTATAYAGGATASSGTSASPVDQLSAPGASQTFHHTGPVLSRPVTLAGGEWQCPWPHEAEQEQIDEQTVTLRATVAADGHALSVDVLVDPGYGFAAAARACAILTRFTPALDPSGRPTGAKSPPIRVRFTR